MSYADDTWDQEASDWADDDHINHKRDELLQRLTKAYHRVTVAGKGEKVCCPSCGEGFVKKTKDHRFCSNQRSKGKKDCKSYYHNVMKLLED